MDNCAYRMQFGWGSSNWDTPTITLNSDLFSTNAFFNPLLHNWSAVYIRYCDGMSFTGDQNGQAPTGAYYRGHRILRGVLQHLADYHGLTDATDVITSGCSAGGLASIIHADYIKDWIANVNPQAKVGLLADSGLFLDVPQGELSPSLSLSISSSFPFSPARTPDNFRAGMQWIYSNANPQLNQNCLNNYGSNDKWRCLFAQYSAEHMTTPQFHLQSRRDAWCRTHLIGNPYQTINAYAIDALDVLQNKISDRAGNGAFVTGCDQQHCSHFNGISINNVETAEAIKNWWESDWNSDITFYYDGSTTC